MKSTIIIGVLVDKQGNSLKAKILKGAGELGFEEAAQQAVMKLMWKPALQQDKPIQVWISVPVVFKLIS